MSKPSKIEKAILSISEKIDKTTYDLEVLKKTLKALPKGNKRQKCKLEVTKLKYKLGILENKKKGLELDAIQKKRTVDEILKLEAIALKEKKDKYKEQQHVRELEGKLLQFFRKEKEEKIKLKKERELAAKQSRELSQRGEKIQKLESNIRKGGTEVRMMKVKLEKLNKEVDSRKKQLELSSEVKSRLEMEKKSLVFDMNNLNRKLEKQRTEIAKLEERIYYKEEHIKNLEQGLKGVKNSYSWKITKPVRWFAGLFLGSKSKKKVAYS